MKFNEMKLSKPLTKALGELAYIEATEIQEKTIPQILMGKDVIGQSQTGTGKTAAFGLPIIEQIDGNSRATQAVVILPTRELAVQVANELRKFSKYVGSLNIATVYGGQGMEPQIRELKRGAQIVVGTPGRMMDHLRRKTLRLENVKMVVLDEADEMLNMGFEEDIQTILETVPRKRQTILFSATLSARIMNITKKYLTEPENIKVKSKNLTVDKIEQMVVEVKSGQKDEAVTKVLDYYMPNKCIIFSNTKSKVDELVETLKDYGYKAEGLHGDMKQNQRERIMKKLKRDETDILIATDVAARGIDVDGLDLVINYDIPQEVEYYVHRIGRTGRNGKAGVAVTFTTSRNRNKLKELERYLKFTFKIANLPEDSKIQDRKNLIVQKKIQDVIDKNKFEVSEAYDALVNLNGVENLSKALFTMLIGKGEKTQEAREKGSNPGKNRGKSDIPTSGNVKLFMSIGKLDKITSKNITEMITDVSNIQSSEIKKIKILDKFSFVEVPASKANEIIAGLEGKQIKGRRLGVEIANK